MQAVEQPAEIRAKIFRKIVCAGKEDLNTEHQKDE